MEILFLIFTLLAASSVSEKKYRSDYIYNRKTDAFYKFHTESELYRIAQAMCQVEGGALMVTSNQRDIVQAHGIFKQFPDLGNEAWVGDHGYNPESAEETAIMPMYSAMSKQFDSYTCVVLTREGEVMTMPCYRTLPFFCKVDAKNAPFDSRCGVYSKDYEYFENVGSCYKVSRVVYSWNQAYDECDSEGAHLVILNSELERQVVQNITHSAPKLGKAKTSWFFFAGFRAEKTTNGTPRVFKTIFGQTLKEAGFDEWSENEPNNADGKEYCGSIFKNDGKYNDLDCSHFYGFVCEKEVNKR